MRVATALLLCALCLGGRAVGAPPQATLEQHPGARLPLELRALDDDGRARRLSDFFGDGRVVLLVPGYYRCPQLCGLLMQGLLQSLQDSGAPRSRWRVVGVSIDPQDTPADARARRDLDLAYADFLLGANTADAPLDLHLLTMPPQEAQHLTAPLGFTFEPLQEKDESGARYAHPATVAVITPHGTISRYFNGLRFDGNEMRVALADAAGDRVGGVTSRLALLCAHFDPRVGAHSAGVMNVVRVVSLLLVLALGGWIWRHRAGSAS